MFGAFATENSNNSKIGKASQTSASQHSCPTTCPFRKAGCYAELGYAGIHTQRLNKSGVEDVIEIAQHEAQAIRELSGELDLRIHVVGDCSTDDAARIVSEAAENHMLKHGKKAWSYTHAHNVERKSWGEVSVLRSCEKLSQVKQANEDGYAAAMVVPEFESEKPYNIGEGFVGIPCRNQVDPNITCTTCRLCMNDKNLHKTKRVILFEPHGVRRKMVGNMLRQVNA